MGESFLQLGSISLRLHQGSNPKGYYLGYESLQQQRKQIHGELCLPSVKHYPNQFKQSKQIFIDSIFPCLNSEVLIEKSECKFENNLKPNTELLQVDGFLPKPYQTLPFQLKFQPTLFEKNLSPKTDLYEGN